MQTNNPAAKIMVQLAVQFVPLKTAGRNYGISIHEFSILRKTTLRGKASVCAYVRVELSIAVTRMLVRARTYKAVRNGRDFSISNILQLKDD